MPRVMLNPALRVRTSQPKRIAPNLGKAHSAETRAIVAELVCFCMHII